MLVRVTVLILFTLSTSGLMCEVASQTKTGALDEEFLSLNGVIVASNVAHSLALVRRSGSRRARTLRIGDKLYGWTLIEVFRDGVLLQGLDSVVRINLPGTTELNSAILINEKIPLTEDWDRRTLSLQRASERLEKEMPVLLSETGLVPLMRDGVLLGLRLGRLPDGTVLEGSGLLPGDVLISLNEEHLESVDRLIHILPTLREHDEIRLVVDRRGERVNILYELN